MTNSREHTKKPLLRLSVVMARPAAIDIADHVGHPSLLVEEGTRRCIGRADNGGTLEQAGRAIGKSGDEGIDGIINEDRLGLDTIHVQAKKWDGSVGRPEVQKFVGALQGKRARKGVFITTGTFTSDAVDYVSRIEVKVVLIDGRQLASLMIEHNLGVTTRASYEVKRLDEDFFAEE